MLNFLQGKFMKQPLHPLVVHLPVGLWIGSLICDIGFLLTDNPNFAVSAYYSMLIGLCCVILAAPTGYAEMMRIPSGTRPRNIAGTHMALNLFVTGLFLINFLMRRGYEGGVPTLVTAGDFIFSLVTVGVLGLSGYLGGMMTYNYGVGSTQIEKDETEEFRKVA